MFSQDTGLQGRQIGGKGNSVSRKKKLLQKPIVLQRFYTQEPTTGIVSLHVALGGFQQSLSPHTQSSYLFVH